MPVKAGIQGDSALASDYTAWIPDLALLVRNDGLVVFVMPVKAGIQGDSALASGYPAWIPGRALLARNDGGYSPRHASARWNPEGKWRGPSCQPFDKLRINFGWHPGSFSTGLRLSRLDSGSRVARPE